MEVNDIEHALNYRTITKAIIRHVEENRFALLERMTQEILDLVMENPAVRYAEVEVDSRTRCASPSRSRSPSPATAEAADERTARRRAQSVAPPAAPTLIIAGPGPVPSPRPEPSSRNTAMTAANLTEQQRLELEAAAFRTPGPSFADPEGRAEHRPDEPRRFRRNCLSSGTRPPPTTSGGSQQ